MRYVLFIALVIAVSNQQTSAAAHSYVYSSSEYSVALNQELAEIHARVNFAVSAAPSFQVVFTRAKSATYDDLIFALAVLVQTEVAVRKQDGASLFIVKLDTVGVGYQSVYEMVRDPYEIKTLATFSRRVRLAGDQAENFKNAATPQTANKQSATEIKFVQAYLTGLHHFNAGRYSEAITFFDKTVQLDSNDISSRYFRAQNLVKIGNLRKAELEYSWIIKKDGQFAPAFVARAELYTLKGKFAQAIADGQRAIELDSSYASAFFNLAYAEYRSGMFDAALLHFLKTTELIVDHKDAWCYSGGIELEAKNYQQALTYLSKSLKIDPFIIDALLWRSQTFLALKKTKEARSDLERILMIVPGHYDAAWLLDSLNGNSDDFASSLLDRSAGISSTFVFSEIELKHSIDPGNSIPDAEISSEMVSVEAEKVAGGTSNDALVIKAIDDFSNAIRNSSNNPKYFLFRAAAYKTIGKDNLAQNDLDASRRFSAQDAILGNNDGTIEGSSYELLEKLTQQLDTDPENSDILCDRAIIYRKIGEFSKATNDFTKAIKINPTYADAYFQRGLLWYTAAEIREPLRQ